MFLFQRRWSPFGITPFEIISEYSTWQNAIAKYVIAALTFDVQDAVFPFCDYTSFSHDETREAPLGIAIQSKQLSIRNYIAFGASIFDVQDDVFQFCD